MRIWGTDVPDRAPRVICLAAFLTLAMLASWHPAGAQIAGVRVSMPTVTDSMADFDVTMYRFGNLSQLTPGAPIDDIYSSVYTTTYNFGFGYAPTSYSVRLYLRSDFNTTVPPALEYGDGSSVQSTVLPLDATAIGPNGTAVFRGSFSHTYAAAGTYTVRARMTPDGRAFTPGLGLATSGNPAYPPFTGNFSVGNTLSNVVYFEATINRVAAPTTPVFQYGFTSTYYYPQTIRYITNTTGVSIEGPPPPPPPPEPPILAIPTLGESTLVLLAVILAAAGLLLLRRGA